MITFQSIQDPYGLRDAGSVLAQVLQNKAMEALANQRQVQFEQRGEDREKRLYDLNQQRIAAGLSKLDNVNTANMTEPQLIAAYTQALAGIPQGSQILSEILPAVIQQRRRGQLFGGSQGGTSANNPAGVLSNQLSAQDNALPSFSAAPEGNRFSPSIDGMDQLGALSTAGISAFNRPTPVSSPNSAFNRPVPGSNLTSTPAPSSQTAPPRSGPPNVASRNEILQTASQSDDPAAVLDFWSKSNQLSRDEYADLWKDYSLRYEADTRKIARETQFRTFATNATADKNYQPDDINRLYRYSENYLHEPSLTQRLYFAERDLQKYNNTLAAVRRSRQSPGFIENLFKGKDQAINQVSLAVRPLVELGEIDVAKKEVANLGFGPLDTEKIVNPLKQKDLNYLNQVPRAMATDANLRPDSPAIAQFQERRREQVEQLPNYLVEVMSNNPNASLKLMRNYLFENKGYTEPEFTYALTKVLDSGFKPSDYQIVEISELGRTHRRSLLDLFTHESRYDLLRGYQ